MEGFKLNNNQRLALLVLVGLALLGLAYGKFRASRSAGLSGEGVTVTDQADKNGVEINAPGEPPTGERNGAPTITVYVTGCVTKAGVYALPAGSRIVDAVKAAGGASSGADMNSINLAARLKDGDQITVPAAQIGQTAPPSGGAFSYPSVTPSAAGNPRLGASAGYASMPRSATSPKPGHTVVNINTAGLAELDNLPGVGPATAQKIIEYRNTIGRFSSVDQLLEVKGIGPKKLEQMRPFVAL